MSSLRWMALALALVGAASDARAASVEIHPAGPAVPENLLRIELRFMQPPRLPFDVERHLRLVDEAGATLEGALLDLALPSADGRRITVLMDPGRVKSGAGPNRAAGRALRAGERVRLLVDDGVAGEQTWTVKRAESHPLQVAAWRLQAPRATTRDPLAVHLGDAISSSGEGLIAVVDAAGRRVSGRTALGEGDTVWRFTPDHPWRPGAHALVTHPDLEDPAGNRTCAAFEQLRASTVRCDAGARIPFEAAPAISSKTPPG